jgi:hypothetical protein
LPVFVDVNARGRARAWSRHGTSRTVRLGELLASFDAVPAGTVFGGELITTSEIEHISPLAHRHIHLYGHYPFDFTARPDGHRPLRNPATRASPDRESETLNRV